MPVIARLQPTARVVPPLVGANQVHQHVFNMNKAMREVMDKTWSCGHVKVDGDMFGTWRPSMAKTDGRIRLEALQPVAFRECCPSLFGGNTSTPKDPSAVMKLTRAPAFRWTDMQWAREANRRPRSCRERMGCVAGNVRNHRGRDVAISASVTRKQYYQREVIEEFHENSSDGTKVHSGV